ncbi:hypothetical protein E4U54_008773 [Claviceps lovelessii]|nr:hypothetical protein E4U54_008773 [Claviceps lovelessii]
MHRHHAIIEWHCISKSHDPVIATSEDEYRSPLRLAHGHLSEASIMAWTEQNSRRKSSLFDSCPLCGIVRSGTPSDMEDHVARHLRRVALEFLPVFDEEEIYEAEVKETERLSLWLGSRSTRSTVTSDDGARSMTSTDTLDETIQRSNEEKEGKMPPPVLRPRAEEREATQQDGWAMADGTQRINYEEKGNLPPPVLRRKSDQHTEVPWQLEQWASAQQYTWLPSDVVPSSNIARHPDRLIPSGRVPKEFMKMVTRRY